MARRGIIALIPSAAPLFELGTDSVSHALKQASFALEPKNVITQSIIIVRLTPTLAAETTEGKRAFIISTLINAKEIIEMPQRIYPPEINSFRLPILSDSAPMIIVVRVAATAEAVTITEIAEAEAENIL
jgi:hypothetical protein